MEDDSKKTPLDEVSNQRPDVGGANSEDDEQWVMLTGRLSQLHHLMSEVNEKSPHYKRAQEYATLLNDMLQNAWTTKVQEPVKKPKSINKKKQGRKSLPFYQLECEDCDLFFRLLDVINHCYDGQKMKLNNGKKLSTARFFAYAYSVSRDPEQENCGSLSSFWRLVSDAIFNSKWKDKITTDYSAVYDVVNSWKKLKEPEAYGEFVHVDELKVDDLKDERKRRKLEVAKEERDEVLRTMYPDFFCDEDMLYEPLDELPK